MKVVNGANDDDQELIEQAMAVMHASFEERLGESVYIRAYGALQDEVSVVSVCEDQMGKKKSMQRVRVKQLAVTNPKEAIRRKREKNLNSRENKRRKRMIMKGQIRL